MTIYAYGGSSQTSNHEFRQLTIPPTTTGFHMKKQLLRNQMDTNYVLLYNNRRIDGDLPIYRQIPNFASVTLCALGKGGGNEDKDIVSGMLLHISTSKSKKFVVDFYNELGIIVIKSKETRVVAYDCDTLVGI